MDWDELGWLGLGLMPGAPVAVRDVGFATDRGNAHELLPVGLHLTLAPAHSRRCPVRRMLNTNSSMIMVGPPPRGRQEAFHVKRAGH